MRLSKIKSAITYKWWGMEHASMDCQTVKENIEQINNLI